MTLHRVVALLALGCLILSLVPQEVSAFTNGEEAAAVIGQPTFTSKTCGVSQAYLCAPGFIAFDPQGNLWVSNYNSSRVVEFPLVDGRISNVSSEVIGQPGFFSGSCNQGLPVPTAATLCHPLGIAFDARGDVWVVDVSNLRVLEFPFVDGRVSSTAAVVIGEPNLLTAGDVRCLFYNAAPTTAEGLCYPATLAFDPRGDLWVLDSIDNRALMFAPGPSGAFTPAQDGENASVVIGQLNFTSSHAGYGQSGLVDPYSLAFDSHGDLWIGDYENCRALMFAPGPSGTFGPSQDGENASVALGQSSFTAHYCYPTPTTIAGAGGVALDSHGDLWVSDTDDARVLEFVPGASGVFSPAQDGEAAAAVIGQENFTVGVCSTSQQGLCNPDGLAFDPSGNLWVVDYLNNRIVEFGYRSGSGVPVLASTAAIVAVGMATSYFALRSVRKDENSR